MSVTNAVETSVYDPLMYHSPLPYAARCYPYGFPVDVSSNAREVLDAAKESFGAHQPRFDRPPLRVHVIVGEGSGGLPPEPVLHGQRNLLTWVSNRENSAVVDWRQRFGCSFVTRATVADRVFFRWHFLDALIYMLLELNYFTSLHAACVAWEGTGVLLYGPSGVGKSTLTYACARQGWTYVSDDASVIVRDAGRIVVGEPHHFRFRAEAPDLFPELRGRTVGRELDRKPTIEVFTAGLPIRTAAECRVEHIAFLNRRPGIRAGMTRIGEEETQERLLQDMPMFDPELDATRRNAVESLAEAKAFELRYSTYDEAIQMLEQIVRGSGAA
jgi:HPr serine kinase-like protein